MKQKTLGTGVVAAAAAIAVLATTIVMAAPWQDVRVGARAVSRGEDSPLPTPAGEYRAYLPSLLRHDVAPTPTSTPAIHTPPPTRPLSTPTNTPTPTSTPTPLPVRVLPNHTHYVDGQGTLHVVGEVENGSGQDVSQVGIGVQLLEDGGDVVGTGLSYAALGRVPAGEKTCFDVAIEEAAGWASYAFEAPTYVPVEGAAPDLTVLNDRGDYLAPLGWYLIDGEVRNDHGAAVGGVTAVGTVYHPTGSVLGCEGRMVLDPLLDPEETSEFQLVFTGRDYVRVLTYRVQAGGEVE
jgi:hypothetical protein